MDQNKCGKVSITNPIDKVGLKHCLLKVDENRWQIPTFANLIKFQ